MNRLRILTPLIRSQHLKITSTLPRFSSSTITTSSSSNDDPDKPIAMENPFKKEQPKCILCKLKIDPDYKNVRLLSQFQSPYTGRVYGRHITGLCKKQQERVEKEIELAVIAGLMPAYHKAVEYLKDPKLFNPEKPLRNHKY